MPQSYSLARVKKFLQRIREEQERAEALLLKAQEDSSNYLPGAIGNCREKIDLCEDLLRIAEGIFGSDVKEE